MKHIYFIITFLLISIPALAASNSRYFYSGNGSISLSSKAGGSFKGAYRNADGSYKEQAIKQINRVFGARYGVSHLEISLRFIEFLDYLQDHFAPNANLQIHSGFRNPTYNTKLREKGKLAAKASLHQYGMASDIKMEGVSSETIWDYVKDLKFGGAGFYHGALVHVDVGPARFWDETTSGVDTGISDDNKLIAIITDRDIYAPGESISVRVIRMTAFPIGIAPKFTLEFKTGQDKWKEVSTFTSPTNSCPKYSSIEELSNFPWQLPNNLQKGTYRIRISFCDRQWESMPDKIATPEFEVR